MLLSSCQQKTGPHQVFLVSSQNPIRKLCCAVLDVYFAIFVSVSPIFKDYTFLARLAHFQCLFNHIEKKSFPFFSSEDDDYYF